MIIKWFSLSFKQRNTSRYIKIYAKVIAMGFILPMAGPDTQKSVVPHPVLSDLKSRNLAPDNFRERNFLQKASGYYDR